MGKSSERGTFRSTGCNPDNYSPPNRPGCLPALNLTTGSHYPHGTNLRRLPGRGCHPGDRRRHTGQLRGAHPALFGVTPERGERCHAAVKDRLTGLAGDSIRVEAGPRATGPYGKQLFYVYTGTGISIDAVLIREGLGRPPGEERNRIE